MGKVATYTDLSMSKIVLPTGYARADKNRPRKVVFYGRVSSEHEAQLAALENQVEWYDEQAKYHPNWTVLRKYIDEGITGTQAKKRDAFMEMIEDAKYGEFDLIVTREVPRFARNTVDTLLVTRELKNYGVEVYFVFEDIWTMDGEGEFRLTLMASIAQDESRKTSERVKAGQAISRQKGVLYGNGNILGYNRVGDTYIINEEQAETVRMIYDLYLKGFGFVKIAKELMRLKRRNSSGLVKWDCTIISRVLHNATYKGYKCYLKSWRNNFLEQKIIRNHDEDTYMYVKGDFEPIISEEIWDQCKALRDSKTAKRVDARGNIVEKGERRSENIWVKKLVCKCGSHFRMDKWHINKTGITYGYKCYNILNNGSKQARIEAGLDTTGYCDMGTIADWKMDMMVWNLLEQLHMHIDSIAQKSYNYYDRGCKTIQHTNTDEIEQLTEKLNREQRKLENLTEMRAGGEITKEEYQENKYKVNSNILKLEQRIDELKRKARAAKNGSESKLSTDEFRRIIEEQMDFSKPQISRGLIEALVNKVVPNDSHDFNWYMNLKPHVSDNDYECIGEFVIHFAEAKAYREMRGEMLRSNQWTDLTVRIFI
ncbi:MAG: recombinase family protein [Christensenellales bacterium]